METLYRWICNINEWRHIHFYGVPRPPKLNEAIDQGKDVLFEPDDVPAMASLGSCFIDLNNHRKILAPWLDEGHRLFAQWNYAHHAWPEGGRA